MLISLSSFQKIFFLVFDNDLNILDLTKRKPAEIAGDTKYDL